MIFDKPVVPEPAEPEEMTVELAKAYIAMEIEEVSLIQSKLEDQHYEPSSPRWVKLDGKREGLQLALDILNQTA